MKTTRAKRAHPKRRDSGGFTIIEVLVAVLILSIGMLALVSTAATVTRMIGQGQRYSEAATLAAQRFEILRSADCTTLSSSSATSGAYSLAWTVSDVGTNAKSVTLVVTSPTGSGTRADSFQTTIGCN